MMVGINTNKNRLGIPQVVISKDNGELVSHYISQVYVLHQSGLVVLSRKYEIGCISSEPQLIGGFIATIMTFIRSANMNATKKCPANIDGKHELTEIGTTCSRWIIHQKGEYLSAMLIPNQSLFLKDQNKLNLHNIGDQLIETYLLFNQFQISTEDTNNTIANPNDIEFGNAIDNIIIDTLKNKLGVELTFKS